MNNKTISRKKAYRFGVFAETIIVIMLILQGYRIIARRYKTKVGEVDIIAKRSGLIAFIEVKARKNSDVYEVLTSSQMNRIERASSLFIAKNAELANLSMRFDLVIVKPWKLPHYIKNAWQCSE